MRSSKIHARKSIAALSAILLSALALFLFIPDLNTSKAPARLVVHRGTGFREIVAELQRTGAIRSEWPAIVTGAIIPKLHNIKAGRYLIPPGMSNFQLLFYLHAHPQDEVRITIPEGLELRKVARLLGRKLDFDSTAFMAAAADRRLLGKFKISGSSAEGYLFPGTYNFVWAGSARETAAFLIGRFRKFYTRELQNETAARGMSELQLLTLASIVEAETPLDREKPLVASVYLNRLRKNMRLQADPTVQYALGEDARRLFFKDLEKDSPYNTYTRSGLPPGPICSPGASSILSVLRPAETGYLYFVASGTGGHNFSGTLAGHDENVRKYRNALKETRH
ncbi:MAG: endolytic transglycosylase MltG [Chlorobiaceae bacterium]|nr:endolytic transglycosylase MltG [Chlorobiaceae bacterium]NTV59943.1 endolytic transglycosylase MltG [Chlorobiaceae bacterium]